MQKILNENDLMSINRLYKNYNEQLFSTKLSNIEYFPIEKEVHFNTIEKSKFIFDLNSNLDIQLQKLMIFKKENLSIVKLWIVYVDLRIKNKIFYEEKKEEKLCIENLKRIYQYQ